MILFPAMVIGPRRAMAYAAGVVFIFTFIWYILWLLQVRAWFRKPIEVSGTCPYCGSHDVRPSNVESGLDRIRKRLGLYAYRCRGCTRRFISRSSHQGAPLASRLEPGL